MAKIGRKMTTAKGAKPKLYKRTAVSYQHKMEVLVYLDKTTMEEMMYHGLSKDQLQSKKRQCYAWKAIRATVEAKRASGSHLPYRDRSRSIGATLPPAAEEQLVEWINRRRVDGVPVTSLILKLQAIEVYRGCQLPHGAFTATWSWQKHFMRRHKLAIRSRKRVGQSTPADAAATSKAFSAVVYAKLKELKITKMFNTDQTGVNYEYIPTQPVAAQGHGETASYPSHFLAIISSEGRTCMSPCCCCGIFARLLNVELLKVPPGYTYVCQLADVA
ncbi:hypothetical protein F441_11377 [Phytophthora nicotianae CJ01A1]|uniref:HTH CENPB-type domain-containing protein n=4 Tax=Phytophthora nicotianae TaxID=4792 RepID=V9EZF5_PHYNI|nr:hypothetical protein F443_11592 [Phytophthora nicotianae P1569]ETL36944.1 hypothetical protein L916_11173 [Phytophthora nicotianae]ETO72111.1 hypothetical protein F444_11665 [Phytophthora nicotianae P1976]ETP13496.1 hypothetical protein F441_11377 [Phytophthora nicotianae CJ01A1]ETL90112.1 hypothetical protein L917_11076 [Phytophthora nicotianae]